MSALQNNQKNAPENFAGCYRLYRPSVPNLKNILISKWHLIQNQPLLREIYKDPPLLSYRRKARSLKNVLVRAKFSYLDQQESCLACHPFLSTFIKRVVIDTIYDAQN